MRKIVLSLLVIFINLSIEAQDSQSRWENQTRIKIERLRRDGQVGLWFVDSVTGKAIRWAMVHIVDESTNSIIPLTTNADGLAIFKIKDGDYQFYFEADDYITFDDRFRVVGQKIFYNKFSVPTLVDQLATVTKPLENPTRPHPLPNPFARVQIILEWDANPADLDAHFLKDGSYHISFRNMKKAQDGSVELDRDDVDGYGPETITIVELDMVGGSYSYYVHDYTNKDSSGSEAMSNSKARVKLFVDNHLHSTYTIPENRNGRIWNVFNISRGQIIPINTFE